MRRRRAAVRQGVRVLAHRQQRRSPVAVQHCYSPAAGGAAPVATAAATATDGGGGAGGGAATAGLLLLLRLLQHQVKGAAVAVAREWELLTGVGTVARLRASVQVRFSGKGTRLTRYI